MELCCSGILSGAGGGATRALSPRNPRPRNMGAPSTGHLVAPPNRRRGGRVDCRPSAPPAPPRDERRAAGAESVVHMLRSAPGPAKALELFTAAARQPMAVHTMDSCNYMLELMRAHGRVGDMAQVFDLMQRQIVKTNISTFATVFSGVGVEGGLRCAGGTSPGPSSPWTTVDGELFFLSPWLAA